MGLGRCRNEANLPRVTRKKKPTVQQWKVCGHTWVYIVLEVIRCTLISRIEMVSQNETGIRTKKREKRCILTDLQEVIFNETLMKRHEVVDSTRTDHFDPKSFIDDFTMAVTLVLFFFFFFLSTP